MTHDTVSETNREIVRRAFKAWQDGTAPILDPRRGRALRRSRGPSTRSSAPATNADRLASRVLPSEARDRTMISGRQARAIIEAGEAKAAELGVPVNIAVLDAGAHLKAFSRMDGAVLGSIDIALKKAKTAVLFGINSETVGEYCRPGAAAPGLQLTNGVLATFAGGIPLKDRSGEILGAVGVSGGEIAMDFEIARAAATAAHAEP